MEPNLLAFDTSSSILSLALQTPMGISCEQLDFGLLHQELLASRVDAITKIHSLKLKELQGIICSRGPGSFTGLRIGMALAKGLSQGLQIPVISVTTLDAMAESMITQTYEGYVLTLIDGKKQRFFWALYEISNSNWIRCLGPGDNSMVEIGIKLNQFVVQHESNQLLHIASPWGTNYFNHVSTYCHLPLGSYGTIQNLAQYYLTLGKKRFVQEEFDEPNQGIQYLRPSQAEE
jgi:tRNA threonylcarbamoyl adenosine modification protein YeaZ